MKNAKTISLVDRVELEWPPEMQGNVCQQAIFLGDVDNDGQDELVVGNIRGFLLIYKEGAEQKPWRYAPELGLENVSAKQPLRMEATHRQHLPSNSKVMLLADIDSDGCYEMVVGYSDRVVQSFRWHDSSGSAGGGELVALEKWQLTGQIGSISLHHASDGSSELLVSQPGGTYVSLSKDESGPTYRCHLMASSARARTASVFTELVGDVRRPDSDGGSCLAMCTLEGALILLDDNKMLFDLQVDHQLFGLSKLDVTGNGTDAVVVCSWDGQTYIVSEGGQVTRFHFDEPVCAFVAGTFCVKAGMPSVPSLVYVSLDGSRLSVYHGLHKNAISQPKRLTDAMHECDEVAAVCEAAGVHGPRQDQLRSLYEWCLYGCIASSNGALTQPS